MLNHITIMGRLVADPELRTTPQGVTVATMRLAVDRDFKNKQTGERETDFINVVAWRSTAEFVCKYFTKGQMMAVTGPIQTRNYEDKQGNKRTAFEIVANEVSFCGYKDNQGGNKSKKESVPDYSHGADEDFDPALGDDDFPF